MLFKSASALVPSIADIVDPNVERDKVVQVLRDRPRPNIANTVGVMSSVIRPPGSPRSPAPGTAIRLALMSSVIRLASSPQSPAPGSAKNIVDDVERSEFLRGFSPDPGPRFAEAIVSYLERIEVTKQMEPSDYPIHMSGLDVTV